jgi:hypothetical protein
MHPGVFSGFVGLSHFPQKRRDAFWRFIHRVFLLLGVIAGGLGLIKLGLLNRGVFIPYFYTDEGLYPQGSSLNGDYNIFALGLYMSLGSAFWLQQRDSDYLFFILSRFGASVMIVAALLTGSRRAVVFFVVGLIILAIMRYRKNDGETDHSIAMARANRRLKWLVRGSYGLGVVLCILFQKSIFFRVDQFLAESAVEEVTTRSKTLGASDSVESRTVYWDATFATIKDFTPIQSLLGDGFGYIGTMGVIVGAEEDYPHNFLLSALLYGGLFQASLAVLWVLMAMYRSLSAGSRYRVLAFFILLNVMFSLTSSNSIFSTELSVIFMVFALDVAPPSRQQPRRYRAAPKWIPQRANP